MDCCIVNLYILTLVEECQLSDEDKEIPHV